MDRYSYTGPVCEFGNIVSNNWSGETMATSPAKAKSNLCFRYKKMTGRTNDTKISLPGQIIKVEE